MGNRADLQTLLETLLGSRNVYYQRPTNTGMKYPAIRYKLSNIKTTYANDSLYSHKKSYELIVIDEKPDNPVIDKLLRLPYCSFNNHYVADNLNHDVFTIYY